MVPEATDPDATNPLSPTDGALVTQVIAGQRDAFDVLINRYQRQAVAVSYRLLGNTHDALEVTQDSFLKAFRSLATLQKPEAFGGWLMRIVSNLSLNYRRSRALRMQLPLSDTTAGESGEGADRSIASTAGSDDPLRSTEGHELGERITAALEALPEKQRLAIVMFAIQELPQKQVAEALNCSVEAVKWHVFQGRKKLKEMLGEVL